MSAPITLSHTSAVTAFSELSVAINRTKERLSEVTSPQAKAIYQDMLPPMTAARDELASQLWPKPATGGAE